jgi:HD superfamily phosphohydrolase
MNRSELISHLDADYRRPIRDPLWKHIYLSDPLLRIIDTKPCRQLSRIKQLGPAFLVYPGATHTRLNHSFGVFHLAKRIVRVLLGFSDLPSLSIEGVKAFLCASLLHDVGHFPYAHSFKELPLEEHEALTGHLVQEGELSRRIREELRVDPFLVAAIVDDTLDTRGNAEIHFFRRILSGALDPDKLDYLNRDAYFCGVPYGVQDIDFALSRIVPDSAQGLAIDATGVSAIESLLFSKYLMYRAVYWHRTVRVATAMIKKAVYLGLTEGEITADQLYGLDDEQFFTRFTGEKAAPFRLVERVYNRDLYRPILDLPFSEDHPFGDLGDLGQREALEGALAAAIARDTGIPCGSDAVILDVPEAISFEVNLPVVSREGTLDYPESATVFTPQVVKDFTRTLRRVRLMVRPDVAEEVADPEAILLSISREMSR